MKLDRLGEISVLICYECGKFFDNEEHKPIFGECDHSICLYCVNKTTDCPVCRSGDVFRGQNVDEELLVAVEDANSLLKNNEHVEKVKAKIEDFTFLCTKCSDFRDATRICACCVKEFGFDLKKSEPEPEGASSVAKWIFKSFALPISCGEFLICENCADRCQQDEQHEILEIKDIENWDDIIKMEIYISFYDIRESLHDIFLKVICQYRLWTRELGLLANLDILEIGTDMKQCPCDELKKIYEDSKINRLELIARVKKLKAAELRIHQKNLRTCIWENKYPVLFETLQKIDKSFTEILGQEEYEEFDDQISEKMEKLETEFKNEQLVELEVEEDFERIFKHQALLEELRTVKLKVDCGMNNLKENVNNVKLWLKSNLEKFAREDIARYIVICKTDERLENSIIEMIEFRERIIFCRLMQLKFFPFTSDSTVEDAIFDQFIHDFKKYIQWNY